MSAVERVDQIIRDGRERLAALKVEQDGGVFDAVRARQPVTIWGVRYVPADDEVESP